MMPTSNDVEHTTRAQLTPEQRKRASVKISKMWGEKDRPREQIIAIGLRLARDGQIGPRGGYDKK